MSRWPDTITVAPRTGITAEGVATYGTAVSTRASAQGSTVIVTDAQGDQSRAPGKQFHIPGRFTVANGDKIVFGGQSYEVVGLNASNEFGKLGRQVFARLI